MCLIILQWVMAIKTREVGCDRDLPGPGRLLHLELVHRLIRGACSFYYTSCLPGQCLLTLPVRLASVLAAPKLPVPEHAP